MRDSVSDVGLHRAERHAEGLRGLSVREGPEVDGFDAGPRRRGQARHRPGQLVALLAGGHRLGDVVAIDVRPVGRPLAVPAGLARTDAVDRAAPRHHGEPGFGAAPGGVEARRPPPHLQEGLLQDVLRVSLADDDSPDEGQEVAGGRVVQSGEGLLVPFADRADEAFQFAAGRRIGGSCLHGLNRNGHSLSPEREGVEVDPAGGLDLQRPLLAFAAR